MANGKRRMPAKQSAAMSELLTTTQSGKCCQNTKIPLKLKYPQMKWKIQHVVRCKPTSTSKCTGKHTICTSVQRCCCMQQAMCHKGTTDWAYGTRLATIACCMLLAYLADAKAAASRSKWRLAHSRLANVTLLARPAAAWLANRPYAHTPTFRQAKVPSATCFWLSLVLCHFCYFYSVAATLHSFGFCFGLKYLIILLFFNVLWLIPFFIYSNFFGA